MVSREGSISRIACLFGLVALASGVHACGGDDGPCGPLARLCADEGRELALGLRVQDAVYVDLDGESGAEPVALSYGEQQLAVALDGGWRSLLRFGGPVVGLAALPGEVAVALTEPPTIALFGLDAAGRLERRRDIELRTQPTSLRSADLSGDGEPELIAGLAEFDARGALRSKKGKVAVIDPRSGATQELAAGTYPAALNLDDVDGDGHLDVVALDRSGGTLQVLLGAGDGQLRPARAYPAGSGSVSLHLADHDGDGDIDAVTRDTRARVMVHRNNGAGEFSSALALPSALPKPVGAGLAVGPVAGSGLVGVSVPHPEEDVLRTWYGKGATLLGHVDLRHAAEWVGGGTEDDFLVGGRGWLSRFLYQRSATPIEVWRSPKTTASGARGLATGDMDGDHLLDVAIIMGERLRVFRGGADLGFEESAALELDDESGVLAIADVTGDGAADVLVASATHLRVAVGAGDGSIVWGGGLELMARPSRLVPLRTGPGQPAVVAVVGRFEEEAPPPAGLSLVRFSADGSSAETTVLADSLVVQRVVAVDFDEDDVDEPLILGQRDGVAVLTRMLPNGASYDPGVEHELAALLGLEPTESFGHALAVADLDGDGAPEAVLGYEGSAVRVTGLVDEAPAATMLDSPVPTDLRDVDGDGHVDAVFLYLDWFMYAPGRGDGTFGERFHHDLRAYELALAARPDAQFDLVHRGEGGFATHLIREVARPVPLGGVDLPAQALKAHVADVDQDGCADVVVDNGNGVTWLWGDEAAPLAQSDAFMGTRQGRALGDLDGDGELEVVATLPLGEIVALHARPSRAARTLGVDGSQDYVAALAIADVDRDGRPDLLAATTVSDGDKAQLALEVAFGTAPYEFAPWTRVAVLPLADFVEIEVGDVDADGAVDLLIRGSSGAAHLILATGRRAWAEARRVNGKRSMFSSPDARGRVDLVTHDDEVIYRHTDQPTQPRVELARDEELAQSRLLRVADADGDGRYDLVVSDEEQTHVWLLGDDGPRRVTVADVSLEAAEFADVDGDGRLDLVGLSRAGTLFVRGARG